MSNLITEFVKGADEVENGFVRIKYRINDLKAVKSKPTNADVSDENFREQGFSVKVRGHQKGELKDKVYMPFIVKLPHEIVPHDCYVAAEDNFIHIFLKKKKTDQSWEDEIRNKKLEIADSVTINEFLESEGKKPPTTG